MRRVTVSEAARPQENTEASAAELDFTLAYGFSGQRRATGFRSENQQAFVCRDQAKLQWELWL